MGMETYRVQHSVFPRKRMVVHHDRLKKCTRQPGPEQAQNERAARQPGRPRKETRKPLQTTEIVEIVDNVFSAPPNYALVHCVAEDMRMEAGIAAEFLRRYGGRVELLQQNAKVGQVAVLKRDQRIIYYLVTKPASDDLPTYEDFRASLQCLRDLVRQHQVTHLAMPMLGCGCDRLNELQVKKIIADVFANTGVSIRIYRWASQFPRPKQQHHDSREYYARRPPKLSQFRPLEANPRESPENRETLWQSIEQNLVLPSSVEAQAPVEPPIMLPSTSDPSTSTQMEPDPNSNGSNPFETTKQTGDEAIPSSLSESTDIPATQHRRLLPSRAAKDVARVRIKEASRSKLQLAGGGVTFLC